MEFAKTFCKPSACTSVVPVGLQTILQYNEHGVLQKVLVGYDAGLSGQGSYPIEDEKTYDSLFKAIAGRVPSVISTKGGTTWVYGVMYSDRIPCDDGILPNALFDSYIKDIINGESRYQFYAAFVHSLAAAFRGPVVIRNFLNMAGFEVLPQVIVPLTMTDDTLAAAMHSTSASFKDNFIAGFFIFEEMRCRYAPMCLRQITATRDPELEINTDGYWTGTVVGEKESIEFNYSALMHHQVEKGTTLLVQSVPASFKTNILVVRKGTDAELIPGIKKEVKCPVCGKVCVIGVDDSPYMCDDSHCVSHMYNAALNMLTIFKLNTEDFTYEKYQELVKDNQIQCLTDVLALPEYKEQKIYTSLAAAMYAVIPFTPYEVLEKFANKCNNKVETVKYYMDNPLRIRTDLDITVGSVQHLIEWFDDPYNITTMTTIFDIVEIADVEKKFEGAPIFRNNKIAITGKFKRGDTLEIESILKSYSATVVTSIEAGDTLPDVIITGGTNESISGQIIQKAKTHGIPIYEEDDFFTVYEIDQDLAQNLL